MSISPQDDLECRGLYISETSAAIYVQKDVNRPAFWIPRSQISYLRRTVRHDGLTEILFYVPEWLIDKKDAWDLVVG